MKRVKLTGISLILVFILCFSAGCGSCNGCNDSSSLGVGGELQDNVTDIEQTGRNLDEDYRIVVTSGNDSDVYNAALELQSFIAEASGLRLTIVRDDSLPKEDGKTAFDTDDKYLCVGGNLLSQSAGIEFSQKDLGLNGYYIKTLGNSVFMGGYGSLGTANAVYGFLEDTVGFRAYTVTSVYVDSVSAVPLLNFDKTDVPDFEWRPIGYGLGMATPNKTAVRRLRLNLLDDCFIGPDGVGFHNQLYYLPADEYYDEHEEWYSSNRTQLCYTAHGVEEEYKALVHEAFLKIKELVIEKPNAYMFSFQHMDNTSGFCTCAACEAEVEKYGSYAGAQNKFLNDISAELDEWIATNTDGIPHDKEIYICGFAYQKTKDAPVTKDAEGNYVPIDNDVVLGPHVSMMIAPIEQDIMHSLLEPENAGVKEMIEQWKVVCPNNLTYYLYQSNAHNYMFPTGGFRLLQDNYKYVLDSANILFDYGQWDQTRTTGFHEFKIYWDSRLMWDVNANFGQVKEEYFNGVYGPAAEIMMRMFDEVSAYMDFLTDNGIIGGGIYAEVEMPEFWSYEALSRWQGMTEEALSAIQPLSNEDPERYEIIRNEIKLESIFTRYALITFYGANTMTEQTLKQWKNDFVSDCDSLGIVKYYETIDIKNVIGSWVTE